MTDKFKVITQIRADQVFEMLTKTNEVYALDYDDECELKLIKLCDEQVYDVKQMLISQYYTFFVFEDAERG